MLCSRSGPMDVTMAAEPEKGHATRFSAASARISRPATKLLPDVEPLQLVGEGTEFCFHSGSMGGTMAADASSSSASSRCSCTPVAMRP
jgi:hypothetical protein